MFSCITEHIQAVGLHSPSHLMATPQHHGPHAAGAPTPGPALPAMTPGHVPLAAVDDEDEEEGAVVSLPRMFTPLRDATGRTIFVRSCTISPVM